VKTQIIKGIYININSHKKLLHEDLALIVERTFNYLLCLHTPIYILVYVSG